LEELFGGPLMQSEAKFIPSSANSAFGKLFEHFQEAENIARLFSEPALFVMPYQVHIKCN
jgi:hypothetical protein